MTRPLLYRKARYRRGNIIASYIWNRGGELLRVSVTDYRFNSDPDAIQFIIHGPVSEPDVDWDYDDRATAAEVAGWVRVNQQRKAA